MKEEINKYTNKLIVLFFVGLSEACIRGNTVIDCEIRF